MSYPSSSAGSVRSNFVRVPLAGSWEERVTPWVRAYRRALRIAGTPSPQSVHEVRVATRHLEVLAGLLRPVLSDAERRALQQDLKRPFHALGAARDCEVVGALLGAAGQRRERTLARAWSQWAAQAAQIANDGIHDAHPRRVAHLLMRAARRADAGDRGMAGSRRLLIRLREVRRAHRVLSIDAYEGDLDAVHRLRLLVKAERYLLEYADEAGAPDLAGRIRELHEEQELLGSVMDLESVRRFLKRAAKAYPRHAVRWNALRHCAADAQRQALRRWRRRFSRDG